VEPLRPEQAPTDPFNALNSFQDQGGDVSGFLGDLNQAGQLPDEGTRPGALVAGQSPELLISLDEDASNLLAHDLCMACDEYDMAHKDKWATEEEIRDAYAMKPDVSQSGNFPGAAQMCSEMVLTMCDQTFARIYGAIEGAKPLIRVDPIAGSYYGPEESKEFAAKTESFINPYTFEEMDFRHILPAAVQRACKVGTAVFRIAWCEEEETVWEFPVAGGPAQEVVISRGRVDAQLVDNRLVKLWPPYITNWQRGYSFIGHERVMLPSEWKAEIARLKVPEELAKRIEAGSSADALAKEVAKEGERRGIRSDQLNDEKLLKPQTLTELWCDMVLPGDSKATKFQVILHRETKSILWIGKNAHHSRKHPYFPLRYKTSDNHGWGSGVGDEILQMWAADTAMFNLMLDSLYAGGYFAILRRAGSIYNTQSDSPRPGMQIAVDDVEKDFKPIKLGGEVPELESARADNYQRARTASGISSVAAGSGDPVMKSGAGTGSTQALIDQAGIKMGMVDSNMRLDLSEAYLHILETIQQYGQEGILTKWATSEDAAVLQELLYQPPRGQISKLFRVRVEAPSANNTNDARQKTSMMIWTFAQQHVQTVDAIVQGLLQQQNPAAIPRWMESCAQYLTAIAQKVADTADLPGIAEMVPQIPPEMPPDQIINQLQQSNGTLQQQLGQAQQMLATLAQQGADMCQFQDPTQMTQAEPGQDDGSQGMDPSQMDPSMMQDPNQMTGDQGVPPS
jgi:hypothetical protein